MPNPIIINLFQYTGTTNNLCHFCNTVGNSFLFPGLCDFAILLIESGGGGGLVGRLL